MWAIETLGEVNIALIYLPLLVKLGIFPFYQWVVDIATNISSLALTLLLTWQKIGPLIILSNFVKPLLLAFVVVRSIISSLIGLNYSKVQNILAISSVFHVSWLVSTLYLRGRLTFIYLIIYSLTLIIIIFLLINSYISNLALTVSQTTKKYIIINVIILSFIGLPPLLGFSLKWVIFVNLLRARMFILAIVLALGSLFNIFIYLRILFYSLTIKKINFQKKIKINKVGSGLIYLNLILAFPTPLFIL